MPSRGFGDGLNLRDKVDAVDEAQTIDAMNVLFTEQGAVRQRDGYAKFTNSALTNTVDSLCPFYKTDGTKRLIAGCGTRLEVLGTDGKIIASGSLTGKTQGPWGFARFGSPNNERVYAGNGVDTIVRWDETAHWTAPANMPKAAYLAVQPNDNRLVATGYTTTTGGPAGATSSPSHVYFSDVGDPESYTSTSYVQLTPSDGEKIQAVIAWREFVFVFKETRFFVFYGNSTDSSGNPIFNYRTVDAGIGLASPRAICSHRSGVYFLSRTGVYRTTGQEPELLSSLVDPIFVGSPSSFYTGGTMSAANITNCAMSTHQERVYLAFPTSSTNNRILVYDTRYEWWTLYDVAAAALASFRVSNDPELVFAYPSASKDIGRHSTAYTNDDGTAITSFWRSGWPDFGVGANKTLRQSKLWGSGKVYCAVASDFKQDIGDQVLLDFTNPSAALWGGTTWSGGTWNDSAGVNPALRRHASRGTVFSTTLTNAVKDQPWDCHRLEHHLREVRRPTVKAQS